MQGSVTGTAERDQVLFLVISGATAELLVMDFQVRHRAACLTAPAIPAQHLLPHILVGHGIKAYPWNLRSNTVHDAFSLRFSRNACF